jgi:hypothetical protein
MPALLYREAQSILARELTQHYNRFIQLLDLSYHSAAFFTQFPYRIGDIRHSSPLNGCE